MNVSPMNQADAIRYMHVLREMVRDQIEVPEILISEIREKYQQASRDVQFYFEELMYNRVPSFPLRRIVEGGDVDDSTGDRPGDEEAKGKGGRAI